jgi:lipid-A-disaccharide synthase
MLPLYEKMIKAIRSQALSVQTLLIISPFMSMEEIEKHPSHNSFDVFAPFDSISAADLIITIPGTNTAQIATAGLPMLVVFPLDQPDRVPLEGFLHYVTLVPVLGWMVKRLVFYAVDKTTKFFALPNMKAGREVVPEIRGRIDPEAAARKILDLLSDQGRLKKMAHELEQIMPRPNASEKIVERMINENVS